MTSIQRKGWIYAQEIGLEGPHAHHWNRFTGKMKKEHIKLGESPDEQAWVERGRQ